MVSIWVQRRAVAEQPAREQDVQKAGEVLDRGDQCVAAGRAGERGVEVRVDRTTVELDVAVCVRGLE
jgi:hypothetical protein